MNADYVKDNYAKSFSYSSDEHSHKWPDIELDIESAPTISSEEETISECDPEPCTRSKFITEMWKTDEIWNSLMVRNLYITIYSYIYKMLKLLPDGEIINEMINKDVSQLLKRNRNTALLITSWLGKHELLSHLLKNGVDIFAQDEAGR